MTLYRGDDTDAFGNSFIQITLDGGESLIISKAIFQCGTIKKTFTNPVFPLLIQLSAAETRGLPTTNLCYLAVWDSLGKKRTCDGTLEFTTQSQVVS